MKSKKQYRVMISKKPKSMTRESLRMSSGLGGILKRVFVYGGLFFVFLSVFWVLNMIIAIISTEPLHPFVLFLQGLLMMTPMFALAAFGLIFYFRRDGVFTPCENDFAVYKKKHGNIWCPHCQKRIPRPLDDTETQCKHCGLWIMVSGDKIKMAASSEELR